MPRTTSARRSFSNGTALDDRRSVALRVEAAPYRPDVSGHRSGRSARNVRIPVARRSTLPASIQKNRTILIASPWTGCRRRWRRGLSERFRVRQAGTYPDLEASITRLQPDALVVDVSLLPIDGIGAVRRWSLMTKVLIASGTLDETEVRALLKAGAKGYCPRSSAPLQVRRAVETVQNGDVWIGGRPAFALLEDPRFNGRHRKPPAVSVNGSLDGLSSREREVARLVGGGARNKEIASQLRITEATVKAHLTAVFRKLDIAGRLHLGLFLARHAGADQTDNAARDAD